MEQGLRLLASRQLLSCMLGVMLCCQFALSRNQQNYSPIASLIVRLGGKFSSLGRAHTILCSAISPGWAPQKSGGAHKKISSGVSRRHFLHLQFQIASGANGPPCVCVRRKGVTLCRVQYCRASQQPTMVAVGQGAPPIRPPYWICYDIIILHPGTLY